ncbi:MULTISPECIES: hypothetical protein [unclassified Streptomyces]|uniref:hypothetical protein n=1 Tax=unclassified Streptomyces TaxID=2593676 RepID=UPI00370176C7
MMKRTVLLPLAGAVVLAASATTVAVVLQEGDVTVSAVCVPIMDTDRDKAGVVDHVAVVTAGEQSGPTHGSDGEQRVTVRVTVDEVLKGTLPKTMPVTQGATEQARPDLLRQPLVPGHRYVIGVLGGPSDDTLSEARSAFFATSADGVQLQAERARWKDAVAHQNPERVDPGCTDVVHVR